MRAVKTSLIICVTLLVTTAAVAAVVYFYLPLLNINHHVTIDTDQWVEDYPSSEAEGGNSLESNETSIENATDFLETENKVNDPEKYIRASASITDALEKYINGAIKKTGSSEKVIKGAEKDVKTLEENITSAIKEINAPKKISDAKKQDVTPETYISTSEKDIGAPEKDTNILEKDSRFSETDIGSTKSKIGALEKITETQKNFSVSKKDEDALEMNIMAKEKDFSTTEKNIGALENDISASGMDIAASEKDVSVSEKDVNVSEKNISATENNVSTLEKASENKNDLEQNIRIPILLNETVIESGNRSNDSPFVHYNFTQIGLSLNYDCVEYEIETQDGYLLKIFRVKGSRNMSPVLLLHAFLDSGDTFLLRGNNSLVGSLFSDGRDVWVVNFRGNKYSRKHTTLDPNTDASYWKFSFHEHGVYDLPSVIDFVLKTTRRKTLQIISYSQAATAVFAMSSTIPEYVKKIKLLVLMAPVCHLENLPIPNFMFADTILNVVLSDLGSNEVFGSYDQLTDFMRKMCSYGFRDTEKCVQSYLVKQDSAEIKLDFLPILSAHFPVGSSMKNLKHISQIFLRKSFSNYDYGYLQNLFVYGSPVPTRYDLSKADMKVVMFVARNDKISTWKDVEVLRNELPNVAEHHVVHKRRLNHTDYIWGENAHKYLYPQVVRVLHKYDN